MVQPTSRIVRRGLFTDKLLDYLTTNTPPPVVWGDGEAPEGGGWTGEQPGKGVFVPYCVLGTSQAVGNLTDTLKGRLEDSWRLSYTVRGVGGTRKQCDAALDSVRALLTSLHSTKWAVGQGNPATQFKVLKSDIVVMGDIARDDSTDPSTWECVDNLEIWLDRA